MKSHSQPGENKPGAKPHKAKKDRQNIKETVLFGLLTAILLAAQLGLSWLPNIELVTVLIIIYAQTLGKKVLIPLYAFIIIEGIIFGFHIWWLAYLYVWLLPVIFAIAFKEMDSSLFIAVFSAIFGLAFGSLTSIPYLFIGGAKMFISTLVAGLSFDIVHSLGNFIIGLVFYKPIKLLLAELLKRFNTSNLQ